MTVALSFSAVQCRDRNFLRLVSNIPRAMRLGPGYLELQLTESVAMNDPETAACILERLGRLGVRLVIDEFGTGDSSFDDLRRFNIERIGFSSFGRGICTCEADRAIDGAIISVSKSLGLRRLAEGLEPSDPLAVSGGAGLR